MIINTFGLCNIMMKHRISFDTCILQKVIGRYITVSHNTGVHKEKNVYNNSKLIKFMNK